MMPWDEQEKDCSEPTEIWVVEGRVNSAFKPWRFAGGFPSEGDAREMCGIWNAQPPQAYAYRVRKYIPELVRDE